MGVVYKARDTQLNRAVAIKLLAATKVSDDERRQRFLQEARASSALNHPNIVTVYEIGKHGDADFIAIEFIDGRTLDQCIPRRGMRLGDALKTAVQIADAKGRHRASRSETRQRDDHGGGPRESPRLRSRQTHRVPSVNRRDLNRRSQNRRRHRDGHGSLRVPGTSRGQTSRRPFGHLSIRRVTL